MRGCLRAALTVALAVCALGGPRLVAQAQAAPGDQAMIRIAHFSPDASYVDVYMVSLNRKQLFPNVFYKGVSAYWKLAAGPFTYEVRPAGATPESAPAIRVTGRLEAGRAYTVAAVGRKAELRGVLFRDDMSPSAPGKAKIRFLAAAIDLPLVDIAIAGGRTLSSGVAFPEPTGYAQLASGTYKVEVRRSGAEAVLVKGNVAVRPGTVTSVALLGGAGKPRELYAFGDATGTRVAPSGGIRTGAGGTAPSSRAPAAPVPLTAVATVGLLAAVAALRVATSTRRARA